MSSSSLCENCGVAWPHPTLGRCCDACLHEVEPGPVIDKIEKIQRTPNPELGTNGMYDLQPHADLSVPALREHSNMRRQRTLEAIKRGLDRDFLVAAEYTDDVAQAVLASLEEMWREDEAFS